MLGRSRAPRFELLVCFIATAIASAVKEMPVKIFGRCGAIRDCLYVNELASGIVSALVQVHLSETYNLSSGICLDNPDALEVFKPLMRDIGCEVQVKNLPERAFNVKANVLNSTKLKIDADRKTLVGFNERVDITRDWLVRRQL